MMKFIHVHIIRIIRHALKIQTQPANFHLQLINVLMHLPMSIAITLTLMVQWVQLLVKELLKMDNYVNTIHLLKLASIQTCQAISALYQELIL